MTITLNTNTLKKIGIASGNSLAAAGGAYALLVFAAIFWPELSRLVEACFVLPALLLSN